LEKAMEKGFESLKQKIGQFSLKDKVLLIPEMNHIGSHLMAGVFRGFGIKAKVMNTYHGLALGKEFTSGKECFPCQVTLGDILYYMQKEKEKLGPDFDVGRYVYFMPEAEGPCRFGMYNKFHRMVLDTFQDLQHIKIAALTSKDSYTIGELLEKEHAKNFRRSAYYSVIVGDVLDRVLWRIRPYEKNEGEATDYMEKAMHKMADLFEQYAFEKNFKKIREHLKEIIMGAKEIMDPSIPRKPLIGIVGEIYLRSHLASNQHIIEMLEKLGAEVVNASIAEWVNYTTYERIREAKRDLISYWRVRDFPSMKALIKKMINFKIDLTYQYLRQRQLYKFAQRYLDIKDDHNIAHLDRILQKYHIYDFEVGTEACLSISGAIEYATGGYNGVVNVFPFTCMPSTITSSIVRPLMNNLKVPYIDSVYDGSFQPVREATLRTFMYQAYQHFERNGGRGSHLTHM